MFHIFGRNSKFVNVLRTYRRGVIIGTGIVTSTGGMMYCFWPNIQNRMTILTQNFMQQKEIKDTASLLTQDVLQDEKTLNKVKDLIKQILRDPEMKEEATVFVKEVLSDPGIIEQVNEVAEQVMKTEKFRAVLTETLMDSTHEVLDDKLTQEKVSSLAWATLKGMFWQSR
jgi:uncharacterized membrane-anchored protein YjiN (DUF445 family)